MNDRAEGNVVAVLYVNSHFPPEPGSVAEARHSLEALEGSLTPSQLDSARLLVSELVSNSVRHAGLAREELIWLRVTLLDRSLRVEVSDPGPGISGGRAAAGPAGGWGLHIVDRLADRWGCERYEVNCVWFELDLAG